MALRRPLWPNPGLHRLGPPIRELRDPLRAYRPAVGRRRFISSSRPQLATHSDIPDDFRSQDFWRAAQDVPLPNIQHPDLVQLLGAIRRRNAALIYASFEAWTTDLGKHDFTYGPAKEVLNLSAPVFSEIIRSLDPFVLAEHDVGGGLRISRGAAQYTRAGNLLNPSGVRHRQAKVVNGMKVLMHIRSESHHKMLPGDYEMMIRCAGSAMDFSSAKEFWAAMAQHNVQDTRTIKTWSEFIKARFLTEPLYYQNDRARVAVNRRAMTRDNRRLPFDKLRRLDRLRLSLDARDTQMWDLLPITEGQDPATEPPKHFLRLLRKRKGHRSFIRHWSRADYYGYRMNEELLCASLIGFSRSASVNAMHSYIFRTFYGIEIERHPKDERFYAISGGRHLQPNSLLHPNARILDAIVEAFGSLSLIPHALNILTFMSKRYDVPIPDRTWSNLFQWAYLCSSKPFRPMAEIVSAPDSFIITSDVVMQLWKIMTSEPHNVKPTFEDYDCYIKTLIAQRKTIRALKMIRNYGLVYYQDLVKEYEHALFEEIAHRGYAKSSPSMLARAIKNRERLEVRRDLVRNIMSGWFTSLLQAVSKSMTHHDRPLMQILIPNLLLDFGDNLVDKVLSYSTGTGTIEITRPNTPRRIIANLTVHQTVPRRAASFEIRPKREEDLTEPAPEDYALPEPMEDDAASQEQLVDPMQGVVPIMKMLYMRRTATPLEPLQGAPEHQDLLEDKAWWSAVQKRLVL